MTDTSKRQIVVCQDAAELARRAVERIILAATEAIQSRGRFMLALTGGSTPEKAYRLLAEPASSRHMDWANTYLFMGDERFVSPEDSRSNYGMAQRAFISKVPIAANHVFPMPTEKPAPAAGAAAYAKLLAEAFGQPQGGLPPRFDLLLLGMGEDGHCASLFPGAPTLTETKPWVTWSPPGTLPPPVDRITLTFPVLNAARQVLFMVAGDKKALALADVLDGNPAVSKRPAAGIHPEGGTLTWLLDEAAAHLLKA